MTGFSALALASLLGSTLGWSCLDLLRKLLVKHVSGGALLVWMTAGNAVLFGVWGLFSGFSPATPGYWAPALGSIVLNVVANLAYFESVRVAPLSTTVPLLSFTPVFASVFGWFALGEVPGIWKLAGIALAVVGAVVLSASNGQALRSVLLVRDRGSALMLLVALLWAVSIGLDKLSVERSNLGTHGVLLNLGIALPMLAYLALRGQLASLAEARRVPGLLPAGIVVGFAALALQMVAFAEILVGVIETVKRGVGNLLAVVFGRAFFGEPVTLRKVLAVLLIALGVGLVLLTRS